MENCQKILSNIHTENSNSLIVFSKGDVPDDITELADEVCECGKE